MKEPPANAGNIKDTGSITRSGRSPGGGHGNLLQYSWPRESHGHRSVAGYGSWGCKESDTRWVTHTLTYQIAAGLPVFEGFKVN